MDSWGPKFLSASNKEWNSTSYLKAFMDTYCIYDNDSIQWPNVQVKWHRSAKSRGATDLKRCADAPGGSICEDAWQVRCAGGSWRDCIVFERLFLFPVFLWTFLGYAKNNSSNLKDKLTSYMWEWARVPSQGSVGLDSFSCSEKFSGSWDGAEVLQVKEFLHSLRRNSKKTQKK